MKYLYKLILAVTFVGFITACSEDDNTGFSNVGPKNVTLSTDAPSSIPAFVEQDTVFTFTVSLDQTQSVDVQIPISMVEASEGVDDHDVTFPSLVTIPEGELSTTFDIEVLGTTENDSEGSETFTIQVGSSAIANASMNPANISFTIQDRYILSETLDVTLDWDMSIDHTVGSDTEVTLSSCDEVDLDFALFTAGGSFVGYLGAATGSCPEVMGIPASLPNDTYLIVGIWYEDFFPVELADMPMPITASFYRQGTLETPISYTQLEADAFTTTSADDAQSLVAAVEVMDGDFTILSADAEELGNAKIDNLNIPSDKRR